MFFPDSGSRNSFHVWKYSHGNQGKFLENSWNFKENFREKVQSAVSLLLMKPKFVRISGLKLESEVLKEFPEMIWARVINLSKTRNKMKVLIRGRVM